ncbi:MAG: N-acetyl-1-D-myo-inositol-2-amino-2-deoxy-alpha-D-glucopyranoside deacetylase [Candidatus Nanopelagicales bacterium]
MSKDSDRRMLLVHAHPDDETIGSGVTMAKYAADGAHVALVTCTLGEEGEVLVADLAHIGVNGEDRLGDHRINELGDAMKVLGVADWRLLGEPGKYRDSGMMGEPSNNREGCFWQTDLLAAAEDLVPVIRSQRPHVLITYDDFGGYGHPDHIQAHRTAMYASQLAAAPTFRPDLGEAWDIPKIYWTAISKSMIRAGIEALRASGDTSEMAMMDPDEIPFGVDDELVTTQIDGRDFLPNKVSAMRSYPTQINMESGFFSFAELPDSPMGIEHFRLVKGRLGDVNDTGHETDLFSGVTSN